MGDLTRRAFLRGTILTGATIAAGGLSTTSTTPVKVLPAAKSVIKFKNLNVLSPKAKAYRTFVKGLHKKGYAGVGLKSYIGKSIIGSGKNKAIAGKSPARQAFETSTKKPTAPWVRLEAKQGVGNPGAREVAHKIFPNPELKKPPSQRNMNRMTSTEFGQRQLTARLDKKARMAMANELKTYRKANPDRMFKKMSARMHSENIKTKSKGAKVGGGGKMALPGMESARNPTGMSLITQRFTL